jgi:hypothetical protein
MLITAAATTVATAPLTAPLACALADGTGRQPGGGRRGCLSERGLAISTLHPTARVRRRIRGWAAKTRACAVFSGVAVASSFLGRRRVAGSPTECRAVPFSHRTAPLRLPPCVQNAFDGLLVAPIVSNKARVITGDRRLETLDWFLVTVTPTAGQTVTTIVAAAVLSQLC